MAEELLEFTNAVTGADGRSWRVRVLGARRTDGKWIGWIRFAEVTGDHIVETDRETSQPSRDALLYWSTGLTYAYLEGSLERALRRTDPRSLEPEAAAVVSESGPRLELMGASDRLLDELIGSSGRRPGSIHYVAGAAALVYEGRSGDSSGDAHYFALRFASQPGAAALAEWLWSRIERTATRVRVDGEPVESTQSAFSRAIVGP